MDQKSDGGISMKFFAALLFTNILENNKDCILEVQINQFINSNGVLT